MVLKISITILVIIAVIMIIMISWSIGFLMGHGRGVGVCERTYDKYFEERYYDTYVVWTDENGTETKIPIEDMLNEGLR